MTSDPRGQVIVVGIDGSEGSRRALDWAIDHAQPDDEIRVLHTWSRPMPVDPASAIDPMLLQESADAVLEHELERVRSEQAHFPAVSGKTVCSHAGVALIKAGEDADLLVVGTRGRGGFVGLLLGSTSTYLAHHATCPLVIVPGGDRPRP